MSDAVQALCFAAGANSIFFGDQLLTTDNPPTEIDRRLFDRLGIKPMNPTQAEAKAEDRNHSWRKSNVWHPYDPISRLLGRRAPAGDVCASSRVLDAPRSRDM